MSIKVQTNITMSREPALRLIKQKVKKTFNDPPDGEAEAREEV